MAQNARKYFPCEVSSPMNIYERMSDEVSKRIYIDRCLYSLTNDFNYMREIVENTAAGKSITNFLDKQGKEGPIYIYGAGIKGSRLVNLFPDKNWGGFIDKHKSGTHEGYPIYSLESCQATIVPEASILISVTNNSSQIKSDLHTMGFRNVYKLKQFDMIASQDKYFERECIGNVSNINGIFVDAGCYDGDDTLRYVSSCQNENARVIAFEADPINYQNCKRRLSDIKQVKLYPVGLANEKGTRRFSGIGSVDSRFSEDGSEEVTVCDLDSYMDKGDIGFIKIDVEGMEEQVLLGAKKIISEMQPMLALSIYHRREDIWHLPQLILSMQPDYQFFLRHYSVGVTDTVLYAINNMGT